MASRIDVCLNCNYSYKIAKNTREGKAIILNLSSTGLMMVTNKFLKPKKEIKITISEPLGRLALTAEVLSSSADWYITDTGKDMLFTTRVVFRNVALNEKNKLIQYIYRCRDERGKARIKRLKRRLGAE